MSTATVVNPAEKAASSGNAGETAQEPNSLSYARAEFVVGQYTAKTTVKDTKEGDYGYYSARSSDLKELTDNGEFTVLYNQVILIPEVKDMSELSIVFTDNPSFLRTINTGIRNKILQKIGKELTETVTDDKSPDFGKLVFEFGAEPFNTLDLLNEVPKRRSLTQREKLESQLTKAGMDANVIASMLAVYDASNAATAAL